MSLSTCGKCGEQFPFETRTVKGSAIPVVTCGSCRSKRNKIVKKYRETPSGKDSQRRSNSSENSRAATKRWRQTETGKISKRKSNTSVGGKAAQKRFASSEKGKAKQHRANHSDAGKARVERYKASNSYKNSRHRQADAKRQRYNTDEAFSMKIKITTCASSIIKGSRKTSNVFIERTAFESVDHFIDHIRECNRLFGFQVDGYGTEWEVEHKIPQEAYDFSDPDDIKRCWSPQNVWTTSPNYNKLKWMTIDDSLCLDVGQDHWPVSWQGSIPGDEEKLAFYESVKHNLV